MKYASRPTTFCGRHLHIHVLCRMREQHVWGCSEECGHCVNGEQCNPVHGTCRNGCETGYYKKRCKRGRASNTMHTDTS